MPSETPLSRAYHWKNWLLEHFAGNLEYHPRRAFLYIGCAAVTFLVFFTAPYAIKFTARPLVFLLGSLTLLLKGIYLLRPSSESIGHGFGYVRSTIKAKPPRPVPEQVGLLLQDFAAGSVFLAPVLGVFKDFNADWVYPPKIRVFLSGVVLLVLSFLIRHFTSSKEQLNSSSL